MISKHFKKQIKIQKCKWFDEFLHFHLLPCRCRLAKVLKYGKKISRAVITGKKPKKLLTDHIFYYIYIIFRTHFWIVSSVGKAKEIKNFKKAGGFKLKFEIGGLWPHPRKANIHGSERKKCPRWKGKKNYVKSLL